MFASNKCYALGRKKHGVMGGKVSSEIKELRAVMRGAVHKGRDCTRSLRIFILWLICLTVLGECLRRNVRVRGHGWWNG